MFSISRLFGAKQPSNWGQFTDEVTIGDIENGTTESFEMEEVMEGDEVDEAEEELVENTTDDDPFLFFAGDDFVGDEDEDEDEDENGKRKKSGWESKNEVARVAKRISRHLYRLKEQQVQEDRSQNPNEKKMEDEGEEEKRRKREAHKATTRNLRRITRRRKSEIEEEELQRAAVLGTTKAGCGIVPRRADHVFMTFLCWILVLTIGTGLLVAGLMGDSKSMQITRHETRTLHIPSTWWYNCLDFEKMSLRSSLDGSYSRVSPKNSEIQFYVFDAASPPPYLKNQTVTTQFRDVYISDGDTNLHYLQFYILKGGSATFHWNFHPDNITSSLVDVLWVKGADTFREIAAAGDSPNASPIAKSRISTAPIGSYRDLVQENDDYFLVFRHHSNGGPAMRGSVSTVVSNPSYDLNNPQHPPQHKYSGLGEICFPFRSNPFVVMAVNFKTDSEGNGVTEDLISVYFEFSKRIPFSMSVSGGLLALIFVPILCIWAAMTCKERSRRRRMTLKMTATTPLPPTQTPVAPPTAVLQTFPPHIVLAAPPAEGEYVDMQTHPAPVQVEVRPQRAQPQPTQVDEDDWW